MSFYRIQQQTQLNSNNYEFGNQIFPNNATLNGTNGYLYSNNNNSNGPSSPLSNNALLNSTSNTANGTTSFNSLNLSTRSTLSNPSNTIPSNLNIHQSTSLYPTTASSRMSNISPILNFSNSHTAHRSRHQAAKGFDLEDDLEFCPEIQDILTNSHSSTASSSTSSNFTHHKFNPYTCSTFSPQVSPTSTSALTVSPPSSKFVHVNLNSTPKQEVSLNIKNITPRAKKVLEIVNPATGLRVTSPNPYK